MLQQKHYADVLNLGGLKLSLIVDRFSVFILWWKDVRLNKDPHPNAHASYNICKAH